MPPGTFRLAQQLSPFAPQSERPGPLDGQLGAVVAAVEPPVPGAPPVDEPVFPQAAAKQVNAKYNEQVERIFMVLLNRR